MGLVHNGSGTQQTAAQREWDTTDCCSTGVGHNRLLLNGSGTQQTAAQREWDTTDCCSTGVGHNRLLLNGSGTQQTAAQREWDHFYNVHCTIVYEQEHNTSLQSAV